VHPANNKIATCSIFVSKSQTGATASINGANARKIHDPLHQAIPVYLGQHGS
jgi:hypothetical protein